MEWDALVGTRICGGRWKCISAGLFADPAAVTYEFLQPTQAGYLAYLFARGDCVTAEFSLPIDDLGACKPEDLAADFAAILDGLEA